MDNIYVMRHSIRMISVDGRDTATIEGGYEISGGERTILIYIRRYVYYILGYNHSVICDHYAREALHAYPSQEIRQIELTGYQPVRSTTVIHFMLWYATQGFHVPCTVYTPYTRMQDCHLIVSWKNCDLFEAPT